MTIKTFILNCFVKGMTIEEVRKGLCARCGFPRGEHHYNGACYAVCGEFDDRSQSTNKRGA